MPLLPTLTQGRNTNTRCGTASGVDFALGIVLLLTTPLYSYVHALVQFERLYLVRYHL